MKALYKPESSGLLRRGRRGRVINALRIARRHRPDKAKPRRQREEPEFSFHHNLFPNTGAIITLKVRFVRTVNSSKAHSGPDLRALTKEQFDFATLKFDRDLTVVDGGHRPPLQGFGEKSVFAGRRPQRRGKFFRMWQGQPEFGGKFADTHGMHAAPRTNCQRTKSPPR